jgi:hypothetical protein
VKHHISSFQGYERIYIYMCVHYMAYCYTSYIVIMKLGSWHSPWVCEIMPVRFSGKSHCLLLTREAIKHSYIIEWRKLYYSILVGIH